jgi:hypothetical protein
MAGIKNTKIIKGQPHLLTYITPNEVEKLKALGGQETMTPEGIPAYPDWDIGKGTTKESYEAGRTGPTGGKGGSTFKTYKGGKYIGVDSKLASKYGKGNVKKAADKALARGYNYNSAKGDGFFTRGAIANRNFQQKANRKLAQRNAFLAAQNIEQYVDPFDDYTMDGVKAAIARGYKVDGNILGNAGSINFTGYDSNPLTNPDATDPSLGYNFSNLDKGMKTLTSNKGTSIEKTRPNLYRVNSNIPGKFGFLNKTFDKIRPDTQVTAQNTLDQLALGNILAGDPNITREKVLALSNRGKLPEQINPMGSGRLDQANILPIPVEEQDSEYTNDFTYRFGDDQDVIYDNYGTAGYRTTRAAEGGIMGTRARRAMGGIMNRVDQRQGYFLGKIVKGIGKAIGGVADAAGKVLKSDLGKYAIMAAGMYYGGGGRMPFTEAFKSKGFGGAKLFGEGSFFSKANPLLFSDNKFNPLKFAGLTTAIGAGMGPAKQDTLPGFSNRGAKMKDSKGNDAVGTDIRAEIDDAYESGDPERIAAIEKYYAFLPPTKKYMPYSEFGDDGYRTTVATGGRIGRAEGGLMDLGGMEKDYRAEGGFVPIGEYEKKDDVPARLSVNEFVMTADAVRGAGQGDIDKGAEIMENMMKNLENGGTVSEESQGNKGAQQMFKTSERLGAII